MIKKKRCDKRASSVGVRVAATPQPPRILPVRSTRYGHLRSDSILNLANSHILAGYDLIYTYLLKKKVSVGLPGRRANCLCTLIGVSSLS